MATNQTPPSVNPVLVKKLFRHILDANQQMLSREAQQRRLAELATAVDKKMDLIESEMGQLTTLLKQYKDLDKSIKSQQHEATLPQGLSKLQAGLKTAHMATNQLQQPQTQQVQQFTQINHPTHHTKHKAQIDHELRKLETVHALLSRNPQADPKHLAQLAERIKSAKAKVKV